MPELNQEELKLVEEGNAVLVNRTLIILSGGVVRIVFADQVSPTRSPIFKYSIAMSVETLTEFNKLLKELLDRYQSTDLLNMTIKLNS